MTNNFICNSLDSFWCFYLFQIGNWYQVLYRYKKLLFMQVFDAFSYLYLVSSQRLPYMGVLIDFNY